MAATRVGLPALLPYLRMHRGTLAVVAALSLFTAGAALVQRIGHVAVLYRPSKDHRQIVLPRK